MKNWKQSIAAAVMVATTFTSSIAAAEVVRPGTSLVDSRVSTRALRAGSSVSGESNLFGAPLFALILGGIAITIGTIVIINNDDDSPASPN